MSACVLLRFRSPQPVRVGSARLPLAIALRRADGPVVSFVFWVIVASLVGLACVFWGMRQGAMLRGCPARLEDGRALIARNLTSNRCLYGWPRAYDNYTPQELRRLAGARERMRRVKP